MKVAIKLANTVLPCVSNSARTLVKGGKKAADPILGMRRTFVNTRKAEGTKQAIKTVFEENGYFATGLSATGALVGTCIPTPIPTGLIAAVLGYFTGRGVDKSLKYLVKTIKMMKK